MNKLLCRPRILHGFLIGLGISLTSLSVSSLPMYAEGAERPQQRESSAHAVAAANPEFTLPSSVHAPESVQQFARDQARVLAAGSTQSSNIWGRAELRFFPLGPGTHGWLVHAYVEDAASGYMIIVASEQGDLILSEYGEGKDPLYSFSLLKQALLRQQLDPHVVTAGGGSIELRYMPPMLAYWSVKQKNGDSLFIDAAGGDLLPFEVVQAAEQRLATGDPHSFWSLSFNEKQQIVYSPDPHVLDASTFTVDQLHAVPLYDPVEQLSWITSPAIPVKGTDDLFKLWGQGQSIVFSAGERNMYYGGPLPVGGIQVWTSLSDGMKIAYAAIGGSSTIQRRVPLQTLIHDGHFYVFDPLASVHHQ